MKRCTVLLSVICLSGYAFSESSKIEFNDSFRRNENPGTLNQGKATGPEGSIKILARVKVERGKVIWAETAGDTDAGNGNKGNKEVLLAGPVPGVPESGDSDRQVPLAAPDLVVTAVAVIDATGPVISYQGTVQNQGAVTASGTVHNYIYLSLDTAIKTTDYKIDDWEVSGSMPAGASLNSGTLTTMVSGIPGGEYYLGVWVDAENGIAESNENNNTGYDASPKVVIPLSAPTGVSASDGSSASHVHITWNSVSGASHYAVYRNTVDNSAGAAGLSAWQINTSYDDNSAVPGVTYYYFVRAATSSSGDHPSPYSAPDAGWRSLSAPSGVEATDGTYTDRIHISWNTVSGAGYYRVYRNTENNLAGAVAVLGYWQSGTSLNDYDVAAGQITWYWVKAAVDDAGTRPGPMGGPDSGYPLLVLSAPASVSATDGTYTDKVEITWSGVSGATHYRVYRNSVGTTVGAVALGNWQTGTTLYDAGAPPGVTFYYWVKAALSASGDNESAFSDPDDGWRKLLPPSDVSASSGTYTDKIHIEWGSVAGAVVYCVYRRLSGDIHFLPESPWLGGTEYDDTEALPGQYYRYMVIAAINHHGTHASDASQQVEGLRRLLPPAGVSATDGMYTYKILVSWNSVSGASHYLVFRNRENNPAGAVQQNIWQTPLSYNDTNVAQGVTYWYWVRAAADPVSENYSDYSDSDSGYAEEAIIEYPEISIVPDTLDFETAEIILSFSVNNTGGGTLNWSISVDPEKLWITSVSPLNGSGHTDVSVTVDRTALSVLSDTTALTLTSNGGDAAVTLIIRNESGSLPENWTFRGNTGNNSTVVLPVSAEPDIDGIPLEAGDYVGVFTPGGLCCGWSQWQAENMSITLWGDDTQTPDTDGFQSGDTICFRIWEQVTETEYMAIPEFEEGHSEVYQANGFSVLTGLTGILSTGIGESVKEAGPAVFELMQNYPNPFNPETTIRFTLPADGEVMISIHNVTGREVRTLYYGMQRQGRHLIKWDGRDNQNHPVSGGIYFCRLRFGANSRRIKMLFLR